MNMDMKQMKDTKALEGNVMFKLTTSIMCRIAREHNFSSFLYTVNVKYGTVKYSK